MNYTLPISPVYRRAIFEGLALQTVLACICGLVLDFGQAARICGIALLAFWAGALVLILRHRTRPTRLDLGFIRIGYLPVIVLAGVIVPAIWHLRGV